MRDGEDARDFIINLTPLVIRVSLEGVYVDERNRSNLVMERQHYSARMEDFFFEIDDSLNLHSTELSVFLKSGHYDIIYKNNWNPLFQFCVNKAKEDPIVESTLGATHRESEEQMKILYALLRPEKSAAGTINMMSDYTRHPKTIESEGQSPIGKEGDLI